MAITMAILEPTKLPTDEGVEAQATVKRLAIQAAKCDRLAALMSRAKIAFSAAKSDYENAVEELRNMSREPQYPLLAGDPEAWTELPISGLGLSAKMTDRLMEAVDGATMGHLSTWLKTHQITDITGFGPAAHDNFADAMEGFWKAHPQPEGVDQ